VFLNAHDKAQMPVVVVIKNWAISPEIGANEELCCKRVYEIDKNATPQLLYEVIRKGSAFGRIWEAATPLADETEFDFRKAILNAYSTPLPLLARLVELLLVLRKAKVIHGDIKPSNFVMLKSGQLALIDFSGSFYASDASENVTGIFLTKKNILLTCMFTSITELMACQAKNIRSVTPHYVAPELDYERKKDDRITNKVDIYSAGATLNELVPLYYSEQRESNEYGINEGRTINSDGSSCCAENHQQYDDRGCMLSSRP